MPSRCSSGVAEALAHVTREPLHLCRMLLTADEAGQRPRTALVRYEPQRFAVHEEQLMQELRVLVEVAHGCRIRDSWLVSSPGGAKVLVGIESLAHIYSGIGASMGAPALAAGRCPFCVQARAACSSQAWLTVPTVPHRSL